MFVVVLLACGMVGYFSGMECLERGEILRAICFGSMALGAAMTCLNVVLDTLVPRYSLVAIARRVLAGRQLSGETTAATSPRPRGLRASSDPQVP